MRLRQIKVSAKPFGGVAVLVMGDALQLPPTAGHSLFASLFDRAVAGGKFTFRSMN